ncbi:trypsin epsilon-like [Schistocerca americana]|uniref:trypsin epsilon-like n=1 Tax=Schistocerca americana TaxID=7009 RepID=UPI001F4F8342|nr:trypsin epsilon-like [Schistocerca americana]
MLLCNRLAIAIEGKEPMVPSVERPSSETDGALTAAHCVAGSSGPADLSLRAGTVSHELAGWVIGVDFIKAHPEAKLWRNDIALLRVPRDFPFGTEVQAVALAESPITPGYSATVAGWGRTNVNESFSWSLLNTTVTVSTSSKCEKDFGFNITSDILCARPKTPSTDICEGDGGGALTKHGILYGIVIYGRCLDDVSQNSLYVNVSYFYNRITEATALEPL